MTSYTKRARTERAFARVDAMPPDLRECVHEFGAEIVTQFLEANVTRPGIIRSLVLGCWNGARSPRERLAEADGMCSVVRQLDWLLLQANAGITARTLLRVLRQQGLVILELEPSERAIQASMQAVTIYDPRIGKHEKHQRRLKAAARAAAEALWPGLFQ